MYTIDPRDDAAHGDGGAIARIAAETDGLSMRGTAALQDGFKRIAADSGGYYLVSYRSPGKIDNRFHAVQLRALRPGATVRARAGYWSASPDDLLRADVVERAELVLALQDRVLEPLDPELPALLPELVGKGAGAVPGCRRTRRHW